MTCFWTDLVSTTQFCEAPTGGGLLFGTAFNFENELAVQRWYAVGAPYPATAVFATAMSALVSAPRAPAGLTNDALADSPFRYKKDNSALAGFLVASSCAFAGISAYETASQFRTANAWVSPSEFYDVGGDEYQLAYEDTIQSGAFTVTEAYIAYMQESASTDFHGIAVADLATSRFTVGIPTPGTLRIDYAGGAKPSLGAFTLYGSADVNAPSIDNTGYLVSIVRIEGSVVTGASGSIDVECYITGFRNGNI